MPRVLGWFERRAYLGKNTGLVGKSTEARDGIVKGNVDFDAFDDEILEVLEL